jgi:hypothetical protein
MNTDETFLIICSFLQPLEICRMRYLSSHHNKICDNWLTKRKFGSEINLQNDACPQCGKWLFEEDIEADPTFYDLLYGNIQEIEESRTDYVNDKERRHLLCEECVNDEKEFDDLRFRYKGSRKYQLTIIHHPTHPWAFLTSSNFWNEFRTFIPSFGIYRENGSSDSYDTDEMEDVLEWDEENLEYYDPLEIGITSFPIA